MAKDYCYHCCCLFPFMFFAFVFRSKRQHTCAVLRVVKKDVNTLHTYGCVLEAQHARKAPRAAVSRVGGRTAQGESSRRQHESARRLCLVGKLLGKSDGEMHAA